MPNHLAQVGAVVLAMPILADAFAPRPFEVNASRVKKHQPHFAEKIPLPIKERYLDQIYGATGKALESFSDFFTQPAHCSIKLVPPDVLSSRHAVVFLLDFLRSPVATAGKKPVQHAQIDRSLLMELVLSLGGEPSHHFSKPHRLPKSPKDQIRIDFGDRYRHGLT